jgi:hypothetical protein
VEAQGNPVEWCPSKSEEPEVINGDPVWDGDGDTWIADWLAVELFNGVLIVIIKK